MDNIPFYSAEIEAFFKRFYDLLAYKEPITVFGADNSRWSWLLSSPALIPKLKKYKLPKLKVIDLSAQADSEKLNLNKDLENISKDSVVAIIGAGEQILQGEIDTVRSLIDLLNKNDLGYVFFLSKNILHPNYASFLKTLKAGFSKNILYFPLSSKNESLEFISYLSDKYHISISKKTARYIYSECGGYFWLMKQCVRIYRDVGFLKDDLLEYDEIKLKLAHIYTNFSKEEKNLLKKLPANNNLVNKYQDEYMHLKHLKWIETNANKTFIRVKLLEQYIYSLEPKQTITLSENKQIMINNLNVNKLFSLRERALITHFLTSAKRVTSKDEIAQIIWGIDWQNKYSDWAIDQFVSRLRKKMGELGFKNIFTVKKGKGVIFNN